MIGSFSRFDMQRRPSRQLRILTPITWLLSFPKAWMHRARINKDEMPADLKPPYLLLCNHNSFMDFMIMTKAIFPHRANYVVAIDGFVGIEWLLRAVGGICNRKFTRTVTLVKNILHARNNGDIVVLFPEARYSLCGTASALPASVGKLVRKMNVPVVSFITHGHHINSPFWHVGNRGVKPVESTMKLLISPEETQSLSVDEINERLARTFVYDDFAWQRKNGIKVRTKDRAVGLHKVLYQCPSCLAEYRMASEESRISCGSCGKVWEMTELGELRAQTGATEFSHIPDWYEWQRSNVGKEVAEGRYSFDSEVRIESLPNSKGFVKFKEPGRLVHNENGFTLTGIWEGESFELNWTVPSLYSCHVEYDYKKRGDCVDLNTNDDTFYLYPTDTNCSVTKIALATEELYRHSERHHS